MQIKYNKNRKLTIKNQVVEFTPSSELVGDVNGDRSVDMKDVLLMRRSSAGSSL